MKDESLSKRYLILLRINPKTDPSWLEFSVTVRKDVGFTRDEIVKYLQIIKLQYECFLWEILQDIQ